MTRQPSRREMLAAMAATGLASLTEGFAQAPCDDGPPLGKRVATLPLGRVGWAPQPFGVKIGGPGLDARLVTDLSKLSADALVTPTEKVYVRTECPAAAADGARQKSWTVAIGGGAAGAAPLSLSIEELRRRAQPMGTHLLECAGNNNPANFGLMSVASWDGVPLTALLPELMKTATSAEKPAGLFVGGIDHDGQVSRISTSGASWILPLASLERLGAFLAIRMNGETLPLDHGRPVRLVVPRWYGCAWIKWVRELRLVGFDEPATSQMREFAGRTHQTRRHELAGDYSAPEIEAAAMPVRVDKWRGGALGVTYVITGIVWGGTRPVDRLQIRFSKDDSWKPFAVCPAPATAGMWALWSYRWQPERPGLYDITMRIPDTNVPQRRLDASYYLRQINIDQV